MKFYDTSLLLIIMRPFPRNLFLLAIVFSAFHASAVSRLAAAEKPLALVDNKATDYVIYYAKEAPASVKIAGQEIQRVIQESTGVEIPISPAPASKMICVGENKAALDEGLSAKDLPDDSYRIVTRKNSIYIFGKDSATNAVGWGGNADRGTLYGAYAFLEKVADVRWLGPENDDIPARNAITVGWMNVKSIPSFAARTLGFPEGYRDWATKMGCGGWKFAANHNWEKFPSRAVLRAHPEYIALVNGQRPRVPDDDDAPFQIKFCTTNPGLVEAYAKSAIEWFRKNPNQRFFSMAPSDGPGWCECEECRKYHVTDLTTEWGDYGRYRRSVTPLVLKFYNDVAKIVAKELPDRVLAGLVYYDFTFPPDPLPPLEPNIALMLAPLQQYGLTRYKPELRDQFERLCAIWGKASKYVGYYGASTWMRVGIGAPLGPSLPILKHTFRTIHKNNFVAVNYYYLPFDSSAVHNYITAKLMWNADADVDAIFAEYMNRAYGGGGPAMGKLYHLLDRQMETAKKESPLVRSDYEMTSDLAIKAYLPIFPEMEALYKEALANAKPGAQRERIEAFGDNLVILHHVFHEAGLLENAEQSVFYRTPEQYRAFLKSKSKALNWMKVCVENGAISGIAVPGKRSMSVPRISKKTKPPLLDGDVSDAAWDDAAEAEQGVSVADKFVVIGSKESASKQTRVLATYDEENLYVSFRCMDEEVIAKGKAENAPEWGKDDYVELVFSPDTKSATFWRLAVNALGTRRSEVIKGGAPDPSAHPQWDSAVSQGEGYWACEMKIPFKSIEGLEGAPVGASWRVNLVRHEEPSGESSSWSSVEKGVMENPAEFGRWSFPR